MQGEQGVKGDKGDKGEVGPQGEQGPKGDPGEMLPEELKPHIKNIQTHIMSARGPVMFTWDLYNSYGKIPNQPWPNNPDDNTHSTGISWGTATLNNLNIPIPPVTQKANGFHYQIVFDNLTYPIENPPEGSPIKFEGYVFWNGFTIPITISSTWQR